MGQTKIKSTTEDKISDSKPDVKTANMKINIKNHESDSKSSSKHHSKKYLEAASKVEKNKVYPIAEAVKLAQDTAYTKFPATLEAHINTTQTGLRGLVLMPFMSGKALKILAFGKGSETAGADLIGNEDTIESINKGKIDFDIVIATPEWMPKLARVARILGPRGIMPNPKAGTVADNL